MSPADAVMWAIERDPILRSTVTAVALLDRPPDFARLRRNLGQAVEDLPRLRQRVAPGAPLADRPHWVDDPHFDVGYHLRRVALPVPGGLAAVLELARVGAMAGLDRARPLWEATVVEGLEDGRAAFIQTFHHCLTDGVGGIELIARLLDLEPDPPARLHPASLRPHRGSRDSASAQSSVGTGAGPTAATGHLRVLGALTAPTGNLARRSLDVARAVAGATTRPGATLAAVVDNARWVARLLAPISEPLSPIMRGRSAVWQFDAFDVDLEAMRSAARAAGGTLNDVFLTAVAAGLRRYHEEHGRAVPALRMTLPISIRRAGDPLGGNRFTPVRFPVPLGDPGDVAGGTRRIGALVREWREGRGPALTDTLASVLARLPDEMLTEVFGQMLKNVDFVATNVPGIPVPMFLAGAELVRQYAFAPLSGASVNVALLSHVGTGCIGVNSDAAAIPDPSRLRTCLQRGFEEALSVSVPQEVAS